LRIHAVLLIRFLAVALPPHASITGQSLCKLVFTCHGKRRLRIFILGNLRALPLINTIEDCQEHWQHLDSVVSFAFSRLIVGDMNLHSRLRSKWRDYICSPKVKSLIGELKTARLSLNIEQNQPLQLNVKTCAGGILEIMLVHFLEEVSAIRSSSLSASATGTADLDDCLGRLLRVREDVFQTNKTLVLYRSDRGSGKLNPQDWRQLLECLRLVRRRFEAALISTESWKESLPL